MPCHAPTGPTGPHLAFCHLIASLSGCNFRGRINHHTPRSRCGLCAGIIALALILADTQRERDGEWLKCVPRPGPTGSALSGNCMHIKLQAAVAATKCNPQQTKMALDAAAAAAAETDMGAANCCSSAMAAMTSAAGRQAVKIDLYLYLLGAIFLSLISAKSINWAPILRPRTQPM